MKVPISQRLLTCCGFVEPGDRVADVGTDHGYLGIYLLQAGTAEHVTATDIRESPLEKARRNSEKFGVSEKMTFFCTPGLLGVRRDFDVLVCAGMGADTIISVLAGAPWLKDGNYRLVLQCQSSANDLRRYLACQGWRIRREVLAQDGRFLYTVMEAVYSGAEWLSPGQEYVPPALLRSGSDLLPTYFARCIGGLEATVEGIRRSRIPEDLERLAYFETALRELREMEGQLCQR